MITFLAKLEQKHAAGQDKNSNRRQSVLARCQTRADAWRMNSQIHCTDYGRRDRGQFHVRFHVHVSYKCIKNFTAFFLFIGPLYSIFQQPT